MGIISFSDEFSCPIAPARMYTALFIDSHNLMPKILPHVIKSVDFLTEHGGPGSIEQVNFAEGSPVKYLKNRLDEMDKDNFFCKYTIIECDASTFKDVEFITKEVKFEATEDGGFIWKTKTTYHPKGDAVLNEEELKAGKEKEMGMYKFVETHLTENPHVYA